MLWTGTDWTVVSAQAGGVIAVLYAGYKWVDKHFPTQTKQVEQDIEHSLPHGFATLVEDGAKFMEHVIASPLFAGLAAKGKVEAAHIVKQATQTAVGSEVKTVLLGAGKLYSQMTDTEKVKAESALRLVLNAAGINLTDTQIKAAFDDTEQAINIATSTNFFQALFPPAPAPDAQPAQPQA